MFDHVSLGVSDLARSRDFYDAVLKPLGLVRTCDFQGRGHDYGAFGGIRGIEFTITVEKGVAPATGSHICYRARDRTAVHEFYEAALSHGGADDGAPGLRPIYHSDYYGAFVLDPDGHRIEAVCHTPEEPAQQ
jgi:catechol 2,3-dioxygenase-like lactoylglutathione lyase family enzyme